ncbi:hypothetical protein SCUCBS95973_007393 [Sporothrix curviconia]|uniref:Protein kinase domain-containing protein n=1 Tax=Sporothrix curviconia TaxID=1260050 RepID=A0ABP0CCZ1_9PEZI
MIEALSALSTVGGVAKNGYDAAKWLAATVRDAQKAPDTWKMTRREFLTFTETRVKALAATVGALTTDSHAARAGYTPGITNALKGLVSKLNSDLARIKDSLGTEPPKTSSERLAHALWRDSELRELLAQTETHARELLSWLLILDLGVYRQLSGSCDELDREVLQCISPPTMVAEGSSTPSTFSPRLYTIKNAEYKPGATKYDIRVLAETFHAPALTIDRHVLAAVQMVAAHLSTGITSDSGGSVAGLLPFLGYQREDRSKETDTAPKVEIVLLFRLPQNAAKPKTLRQTIGWSGMHRVSLDQRFNVARQLAETVLHLQTTSLLHKNIRSDTVFLLEADDTKNADQVLQLLSAKPDDPDPGAKEETRRGRLVRRMSETRLGRSVSRKRAESRERKKRSGSASGADAAPPAAAVKDAAAEKETQTAPPDRREQWLVPGRTAVILTHWSDAKKTGGTSTVTGPSSDNWPVKVYRHPSQQSEQGNDKYHFGHDIYSLGVCLLEIGLWECLVHPSRTFAGGGTAPVASRLLVTGLYAQYIEPLKTRLVKILDSDSDSDGDNEDDDDSDDSDDSDNYNDSDNYSGSDSDNDNEPARRLQEVMVSILKKTSDFDTVDALKRALNEASDDPIKRHIDGIVQKTSTASRLARRCWILEALLSVLMDKAQSSGGSARATYKVLRLVSKALGAAAVDEDVRTHIADRATALAKKVVPAQRQVSSSRTWTRLQHAIKACATEGGVGASTLKSLQSIQALLEALLEEERQNRRNGIATAATSNTGARLAEKMEEAACRVAEDPNYKVPRVAMSDVPVAKLLQSTDGRKTFHQALVRLAQGQLQTSMGSEYANIVVQCLQATEEGFVNVSVPGVRSPCDFTASGRELDACRLLEKAVVEPLRRVNLGLYRVPKAVPKA